MAPTKEIVLIGAGLAHANALRAMCKSVHDHARLTVVTRQPRTPYAAMLPGLMAGIYSSDDIHIEIAALCRFAGAKLVLGEVSGIDLDARRVFCEGRDPIRFDILSIDTGSTPNTHDVPGANAHAVAIKPVDKFLAGFEAARARLLQQRGATKFVIVGGGASGVELICTMERVLRADLKREGLDPAAVTFTLLTRKAAILDMFSRGLAARFEKILVARGIEVVTGKNARRVAAGAVITDCGTVVPYDELFWTVEASAAPWLGDTDLALDERGFIEVQPTMESTSHADVFAAGDVASFIGRTVPKAGIYAVRQSVVLAENLRLAAERAPLKPFIPQKHYLQLITAGEHYAVGARGGLSFEGRWVWHLKDRIDRGFVAGFKKLAPMAEMVKSA
ncbi:FAD-dependent oxidoreductase [Rhodomicrobium sp. Az07]|uniref:FAD-dependent oxidoreductase n=1 Tax=Rhodomicrobium sp. Az07 TaxID=2839034 RepID=UPI001BE9FEC0|nr:FAD-dependent oxidoreductase [Rhodomicrobium sp. Az07]